MMESPISTLNPYTGQPTYTEWQTPRRLFDYLDGIYDFKVDAAADLTNHLCPDWYGPGSELWEDALSPFGWDLPAFCNPPYGKGIERWLEKFREQGQCGQVVALLPARTETQWWAKGIVPFADIIFLTGRVPFVMEGGPGSEGGKKSQPDHPSALCIYSPLSGGSAKWWDWRKDC